MAGYGVAYAKESRINEKGHPKDADCNQCEDTGFVMTSTGLKGCPACNTDDAADDYMSEERHA